MLGPAGRTTMAGVSDVKLILASRSPRRARLLTDEGYRFRQVESPWQDPPAPPPGEAGAVAVDLALRKARALAATGQVNGSVLVAADTIVVLPDGSLAGTPTSRDAAAEMIGRVLNAVHQVVTGAAILGPNNYSKCFSDRADVWVGSLDAATLTAYLDSHEWQGKAGGYNLFDRQAAGWPIRIEGDPATVVGLPLRMLIPLLDDLGVPRHAPGHGA